MNSSENGSGRARGYAAPAIFFISLAALWQLAATLGPWPRYLFPAPADVIGSLGEGLGDLTFVYAIAASLKRILIGFGLSLVLGTALGFLIGRVKIVEETIGLMVLGLQALPSICWLPVAILWFGLNENAVIFVVVMGVLLSITIAAADGVKNIPPEYIKAARTMGASGLSIYTDVLAPAAFPAIVTGAKLGWSFAWRSLMAGELLFVSGGGLGFLLQSGRELNDIARVASVMLLIVLIGLTVDRSLFSPLESGLRERWGRG